MCYDDIERIFLGRVKLRFEYSQYNRCDEEFDPNDRKHKVILGGKRFGDRWQDDPVMENKI